MKTRDFNHPVMVWSIHDDTPIRQLTQKLQQENRQEPTSEELQEAYGSQVLDLSTPAPQGLHDFLLQGIADEDVIFHGITVQEEEFDPHLTAHAVYIALRSAFGDTRLSHIYIEELTWDPERSLFLVGLGS